MWRQINAYKLISSEHLAVAKIWHQSMFTCREVGLEIYGYLFIHIQRLWFDF